MQGSGGGAAKGSPRKISQREAALVDIGNLIERLRTQVLRESAESLAEHLGVSRPTLSRLRGGDPGVAAGTLIDAIALIPDAGGESVLTQLVATLTDCLDRSIELAASGKPEDQAKSAGPRRRVAPDGLSM